MTTSSFSKGRSKSSKSVYIVSDIHDGSIMAVCSPKPYNSDLKTYYKPNSLQKDLYRIWLESIDNLEQHPNICVVNGEPIDGGNPKQQGNQSWSTNLADQATDAINLLHKIPSKEFMFIKGSGYHVTIQGTSIEQFIAERMNAVKYSIFEGMEESKADYWANVEINGKIFSFTHHIPYAKFYAYRPTPLGKEIALMSLDKGRSLKYDVVVRSHVHYYIEIRSAHTYAFTTGAWKYPDGHLTRGGMGGIFPDIGGIEVIVESNGEIIIKPHITELRVKPKVYHVK